MSEEPEYEGMLYAASKDVGIVRHLAAGGIETFAEGIAFHAQQAAEKTVKHALDAKGVGYRHIHDIDELLQKGELEGAFRVDEDTLRAAARLSLYAVAARYTTCPEITGADALQAVRDYDSIAHVLFAQGYDVVEIGDVG